MLHQRHTTQTSIPRRFLQPWKSGENSLTSLTNKNNKQDTQVMLTTFLSVH